MEKLKLNIIFFFSKRLLMKSVTINRLDAVCMTKLLVNKSDIIP